MSGQPCGRCLNCRNGAPGLCLTPRLPTAAPHATEPVKRCNGCGAAVPKGRRYCDGCRAALRRATWCEAQRRRRGTTATDAPTRRRRRPLACPTRPATGAGVVLGMGGDNC